MSEWKPKKVYVRTQYQVWGESEKIDPEDACWTLSEDPEAEGWTTDCSHGGYGLLKEQAEFYAECINERLK